MLKMGRSISATHFYCHSRKGAQEQGTQSEDGHAPQTRFGYIVRGCHREDCRQ